jgi:enoyl-CoA hydratase/carnithine racemase
MEFENIIFQKTNQIATIRLNRLELERSGMIKAAKTDDYKEGLRAFFEKREPHFTGR